MGRITRRSEDHNMGSRSTWCLLIGLFTALALAAPSDAQLAHRRCWRPGTGYCNDPMGDCAYKDQGTWCFWCDEQIAVAAACVWHPWDQCTPITTLQYDCGNKYHGICDESHICQVNEYWSDCTVFGCNIAT